MRLVYLTRNEKGIKLEQKKPTGVKVPGNRTMWFLRGFSFPVGVNNNTFQYNGLEVIGVFDLDKPKHLSNMMAMFESHLRHYLEKATLAAVDVVTPVREENKIPLALAGHGSFRYTPIGSAIVRVFRKNGDEHGDW